MTKNVASASLKTLLLDTTNRNETRLALLDRHEVVTLERETRAQELQQMIEELLEKTTTQLDEVQAIAVLTGPGSFTGTRIGVTTANVLGSLYKIPLFPLRDLDFETALQQIQNDKLPDAVKVVIPSE